MLNRLKEVCPIIMVNLFFRSMIEWMVFIVQFAVFKG